jgi:hypothetical protein
MLVVERFIGISKKVKFIVLKLREQLTAFAAIVCYRKVEKFCEERLSKCDIWYCLKFCSAVFFAVARSCKQFVNYLRRGTMKNRFWLNLKEIRLSWLIACLIAFTLIGVVISTSIRKLDHSVSAHSLYIPQDISKANFVSQQDFSLQAEQDEDAPLKILDAKVNVISGEQYRELTSQNAPFREIVSVPKVVLQNVSDKTVVGVTLFISDKASQTKRGFYIKEQSIKPGQRFTILPENLVRGGENPAKNPKFWLDAVDKSQISVRVVAFFDDGTTWANKNQRY